MTESIRTSTVTWKGAAKGGKPEPGADPIELFAAAHASSFSQALSRELALKPSARGDIETTVTVTLESHAPDSAISGIHLNVIARLPVTQGDFIDAAVRAKTACAISNILRIKISMSAKLDSDLSRESPE